MPFLLSSYHGILLLCRFMLSENVPSSLNQQDAERQENERMIESQKIGLDMFKYVCPTEDGGDFIADDTAPDDCDGSSLVASDGTKLSQEECSPRTGTRSFLVDTAVSPITVIRTRNVSPPFAASDSVQDEDTILEGFLQKADSSVMDSFSKLAVENASKSQEENKIPASASETVSRQIDPPRRLEMRYLGDRSPDHSCDSSSVFTLSPLTPAPISDDFDNKDFGKGKILHQEQRIRSPSFQQESSRLMSRSSGFQPNDERNEVFRGSAILPLSNATFFSSFLRSLTPSFSVKMESSTSTSSPSEKSTQSVRSHHSPYRSTRRMSKSKSARKNGSDFSQSLIQESESPRSSASKKVIRSSFRGIRRDRILFPGVLSSPASSELEISDDMIRDSDQHCPVNFERSESDASLPLQEESDHPQSFRIHRSSFHKLIQDASKTFSGFCSPSSMSNASDISPLSSHRDRGNSLLNAQEARKDVVEQFKSRREFLPSFLQSSLSSFETVSSGVGLDSAHHQSHSSDSISSHSTSSTSSSTRSSMDRSMSAGLKVEFANSVNEISPNRKYDSKIPQNATLAKYLSPEQQFEGKDSALHHSLFRSSFSSSQSVNSMVLPRRANDNKVYCCFYHLVSFSLSPSLSLSSFLREKINKNASLHTIPAVYVLGILYCCSFLVHIGDVEQQELGW